MILSLLAAASLAAAPADQPTDVTGVTVNAPPPGAPADLVVSAPAEDNMSLAPSVWPEGAWGTRTSGAARLACNIDGFGLAETCEIASETPAGKSFGKAALQLRPTFRLPATGGPRRVVIEVTFKAPQTNIDEGAAGGSAGSNREHMSSGPQITHVGHNPLVMRSVTMVDRPVWTSAASWDQLVAAWPSRASAAAPAGGAYAVAHCHVQRSGQLGDCQVIKEDPEKLGFGAAAVQLAQRHFRLSSAQATASHPTPLWVDVPIRFVDPATAAQIAAGRTVASPIWLGGVDPGKAPKLFPPEAAAAGVTTGRGVARCTVLPDGAMTACAPDGAEPDGLGFGEAAAALASTMRMNPWSADASPVDGAVVRVAVRLNLKP